jgi:hypothetical protein
MSNIAGKCYAMNVVTPIKWYTAWINKFIFWLVQTPLFKNRLNGLITLSLIHYARWAIVKPSQFPHLNDSQPKETIKYTYMFFFSNFNGSWDQYVDSFHMAIPSGLNLLWYKNVKYPGSVPLQPFHSYITYNQIATDYYYNAYPLASSNDVKAAKIIKLELCIFKNKAKSLNATEFKKEYDSLLNQLQEHLSIMSPTPIVSLATDEIQKRKRLAV